MTLQPWLDKSDFDTMVGELPESFPLDAKLGPLVGLLVTGWLSDLMGTPAVLALRVALLAAQLNLNPVPLTAEETAWIGLVRPFLVMASWSDYILNGNVSITKTGPVTKRTDYSDPIEPEQRAALSRAYYAKAKEWAVRIAARAAQTSTTCGPVVGSQRTSVSIVRGKRHSYFQD